MAIRELHRITINPAVCLGQPTIRGMRITVEFVLKLLASQLSVPEILASRRGVPREHRVVHSPI